jgi:hypothetical protein
LCSVSNEGDLLAVYRGNLYVTFHIITNGQSKVIQNRDLVTEFNKIDPTFQFGKDCIVTELRFTDEKNQIRLTLK